MPVSDLKLLTDAALEAGEVAVSFWRNDPRSWTKPDEQGPVSEADLAVDTVLRDRLLGARPAYGWLSEESSDSRVGGQPGVRFIVDPIDGTRAFLNGEPTFALSLAVVCEGRVTDGVVWLPVRQKLYSASYGKGAYLNRVQMHASDTFDVDCATFLGSRPTLDAHHWNNRVPHLDRHYRPSLAYRMCLVAEGRYDAMLTFRDSWHWDIAAGSLILAEAGASVTDRYGAPLQFQPEVTCAPGVVAANPVLARNLLQLTSYQAA